MADRVKFELIDYRRLEGRFDRIVSVGMFEHVGQPNYRRFFHTLRDRLEDDGVALIHTIGRFEPPGVTDNFTLKYVFPGGYAPALSETMRAIEAEALIASDVENLRLHYALTIDEWYRRTVAARREIEALYDAKFFRMWTYYLAGSSAAFRHGAFCNYQIQLIRDRRALPITRDYMAADEARLRER